MRNDRIVPDRRDRFADRRVRDAIAAVRPIPVACGGAPIDDTRLALRLCLAWGCSTYNDPTRPRCRACGGAL